MFDRIAANPNIHFGKPCIAGTRIPVQNVLELVEEGIDVYKRQVAARSARRRRIAAKSRLLAAITNDECRSLDEGREMAPAQLVTAARSSSCVLRFCYPS